MVSRRETCSVDDSSEAHLLAYFNPNSMLAGIFMSSGVVDGYGSYVVIQA